VSAAGDSVRPEVWLREVRAEDLPVFFEHQRDPESTRMAGLVSRDDAAFREHWKKILEDPEVDIRTIVCDERVVGNVLAFERGGKREVGYWIGRDHWGRGIASVALAGFLEEFPRRPLHAVVARHNRASLRVAEKSGFSIVGEGRGSAGGRGPVLDEYTLELDGTE
jgi:RimJ/RimL family protein N-acetyltransferase